MLDDVKLTFSLREFKATVGLAESLGVALEVNFSDGDEPLFVRLRVESAVAGEFVIATTKGDRTASGSGTGAGNGSHGEAEQERGGTAAPQPPQRVAASAASSATSVRPPAASRGSSHNAQPDTSSSMLSHPAPAAAASASRPANIPNQSTPRPPANPPRHPPTEPPAAAAGEGSDDETQPLFFPGGASQLSLHPTPGSPASDGRGPEVTFVQPTPVAQGGDPSEFLAPDPASQDTASQPPSQHRREMEADTDSDSSDRAESGSGPRKRFKPLF